MLAEVATVVKECVEKPGKLSVLSDRKGKYICPDDPEFAAARAKLATGKIAEHPPINPAFKLVFLTAVGGTVLFVSLCIAIHALTGGVMPTATQKLVDGI